jgi:hypothetical protein
MEVPELWIRATSDGLAIGPFTKDQVRQMGRAGLINHESSIRQGEAGRWHPASAVKGLLPDRPVATSVPRAPSPAVGAAAVATPVPAGVKPAKESTPKATISKSASETRDTAPRSSALKFVVLSVIAIGVLGGVAAGGYFMIRKSGISIPLLSASPADECDAAEQASNEFVMAIKARNTEIAMENLRSFLDVAEKVLAPDFDARVKKLTLEDQVAVRKKALQVLVFVLALGASQEATFGMDSAVNATIIKLRNGLNFINPAISSPAELALNKKEIGSWELPPDIAERSAKMAAETDIAKNATELAKEAIRRAKTNRSK